jgi:sporulation protein YlmC with PRC-barrel domain
VLLLVLADSGADMVEADEMNGMSAMDEISIVVGVILDVTLEMEDRLELVSAEAVERI